MDARIAERRRMLRQWEDEEDADELAMHVLAASQGIATMSNAYSDREFVRREVDQLCAWVDAQAAQAV